MEAIGQLDDDDIDLADAALHLARRAQPDADWQEARAQLSTIARAAASLGREIDPQDLPACAAMLAWLLHDEMSLQGDRLTYDDTANANLIMVLERRRGLPVALGILWIHAARAAGWDAYGVNFPGHFLVGLAFGQRQVLLDAFEGGTIVSAEGLRALLMQTHGRRVALKRELLAGMTPRAVLLRLQGNIASRLEQGGQTARALATLRDMLRIAPAEATIWLDAARLHQQSHELTAALDCYDRFLALAPDSQAAPRVREAMAALRGQMN